MKKRIPFVLTPTIVLALLAGLLLFVQTQSSRADPTILYVAPGGTCGGALPCYASLQAAVDAAAAGDAIQVAAGVYTDIHVRPRLDVTTTGTVTQVLYLTKTLTLRGGYSADFATWDPALYTTTLDAQNQGRGVYIAGAIRPRLEGLRITRGNAAGQHGYFYYGNYDAGGGVFIITATASLDGNQIVANLAQIGGGVFLNTNGSMLEHNLIAENQAGTGGGISVYQGAPTLKGNTFDGNQSLNLGGGAYLFYTPAILDQDRFTGNSAVNNGGGVFVASCDPIFTGNIFSGNTAFKGGGVSLWYSRSPFTNDVFLANHAGGSGSGLYSGGSSFTLLHSTFSTNSGGDGSGLFINWADITTPSHVVISNTLVVSSSVGISITGNSTAQIGGILWFATPITVSQGTAAVTIQHQHTGDPAFAADGYHLTAGSAAIGAGQLQGVLTDIDGQPRSIAYPDLGADEYWRPGAPWILYLPMLRK